MSNTSVFKNKFRNVATSSANQILMDESSGYDKTIKLKVKFDLKKQIYKKMNMILKNNVSTISATKGIKISENVKF